MRYETKYISLYEFDYIIRLGKMEE